MKNPDNFPYNVPDMSLAPLADPKLAADIFYLTGERYPLEINYPNVDVKRKRYYDWLSRQPRTKK